MAFKLDLSFYKTFLDSGFPASSSHRLLLRGLYIYTQLRQLFKPWIPMVYIISLCNLLMMLAIFTSAVHYLIRSSVLSSATPLASVTT